MGRLVNYSQKGCRNCGQQFKPVSARQRCCSEACRLGQATCGHCGVSFTKTKNTTGRFCSYDCSLPTRGKDVAYYQRVTDYFRIWSPDMAYILGYTWADGCVWKHKTGSWYVGWACVTDDEEILVGIKRVLGLKQKLYRETPHTYPGRERTHLMIGSKELLVCLMKDHGFRPRKSLDDHYPTIPDEWIGHFVRGYFDGDGCVSSNHDSLSFGLLGSYGFLDGVVRQLERVCGLSQRNLNKHGSVYRTAWFSENDLRKAYEALYPPGDYLFLARKRERFEHWLNDRTN